MQEEGTREGSPLPPLGPMICAMHRYQGERATPLVRVTVRVRVRVRVRVSGGGEEQIQG